MKVTWQTEWTNTYIFSTLTSCYLMSFFSAIFQDKKTLSLKYTGSGRRIAAEAAAPKPFPTWNSVYKTAYGRRYQELFFNWFSVAMIKILGKCFMWRSSLLVQLPTTCNTSKNKLLLAVFSSSQRAQNFHEWIRF